MSKIITTYQIKDLDQPIPMDRAEFYEDQINEFDKNGKPSRLAAVVQIMLFTPDKQLIVQKRSQTKAHNVGLLDKSLGAHVTHGDTPFYTVMRATLQELSVPAFVLDSEEDFKKTLRLLKDHSGRAAFMQFVDSKTVNLSKVIDKKEIKIGNKYFFFLGLYNGSMNPDQEHASSILYRDLESLEKEIEKHPEEFTEDLKFFMKKYSKEIHTFLGNL